MKYFKRGVHERADHPWLPVRLWSAVAWRRAQRRYEVDLEALRRQIDPATARFLDASLHDGVFIETIIEDTAVVVLLECSHTFGAGAERARIYFRNAHLVQPPVRGDWWLYEEISRKPDGQYRCEVLCHRGSFCVDFGAAEISWEPG